MANKDVRRMDLFPKFISAKLTEATSLALGLIPVARSGIIAPIRPDRLAKVAAAWVRWDFTPSALLAISARRVPDHLAVIDESGELTYDELERDVTALARALAQRGVGERSRVGVLCRNHRGVLQALGATGRLGGDLVLLNTGLSGKQLEEVLTEQHITVLVVDGEFADVLPKDPDDKRLDGMLVIGAWDAKQLGADIDTVDELIANASAGSLPTRPRRGRTVVLTSGTTGSPKGATRPEPRNWMPASAILSAFRYGPARPRWWRHRCSIPGVSPACRSASPWAPPWCCAASSPPPTAWPTSSARRRVCWSSCR